MSVSFKYQEAAADWLRARRRAYLADVPGLGKTREVILAAATLAPTRTLVCCPASALGRWEEESAGLSGVTLVSYEMALRHPHRLPAGRLDLLVCDEAHRLKSPDADRTRLVLGTEGLTRRTDRVWFLSGTPMPNHPGELFTILATAFPERLRALRITSYPIFETMFVEKQAWHRYQKRFVSPAQAQREPWAITWRVTGARNEATLQKLLFDPLLDGRPAVMLRRTWESPEVLAELAAMPPVLWRHETVSDGASGEEFRTDTLVAALDAGDAEPLRQATLSLRQAVGLRKAVLVAANIRAEMTESPTAVRRVVFAHHHAVLDRLEREFTAAGLTVFRLDGTTPPAARAALETAFQAFDGYGIFLGQNDAAKESLTLTQAEQVELVEPSFVTDDNLQMVGRIRRHGQRAEKLIARVWGLARSYDQRVARILADKAALKQKVGL